MNFASHYYFQNTPSDFYNAGLILADLIPLAQKKPFPLFLTIKQIAADRTIPMETREIINGILDHFEADRIFHQSQFFNYSTERSAIISQRLSPIHSILHHIIIELLMDRYLLKNNRSIIEKMYESFQNSFQKTLHALIHHLPIDDSLRYFCGKFCENRIILRYLDNSILVQTLTRISSNSGISFKEGNDTAKTIGIIFDDLENSIQDYFSNEREIYRKIGKRSQ